MSRADLAKSGCSLSRAVERVGDPWTLMILRESFLGTRRFEDFQRQTGASPHLLSQRLKQLCQDEILRKRLYRDHPQRFEYVLTEKGRDLWPMIMALKAWGDKWLERPFSVRLTHKGCGAEIVPQLCCPDCGDPIGPRDIVADIGTDLQLERNRQRT